MPAKKNPFKLNKLQLRTLALAQVLARDEEIARQDGESGAVRLLHVPRAHGEHVHVGRFVVSARDASGFSNPAVWRALQRKGLVRIDRAGGLAITAEGIACDTGHGEQFADPPSSA